MEKALLITVEFKEKSGHLSIDESALELEELAFACNLEVLDNLTCICHKPTPNFLIGTGKVSEIKGLAQELDIDAIIFSRNLSGTQQRNLERVLEKKTIDRSQLILDIFARRAKSPEGKMQVELAQLEYLFPRLTGKGIILSRQGAGVGTSGPGEKKLEVDRRKIRERINRLKKDLNGVSTHRELIRKKRRNEGIPLVAIVGYTSAGKSTLLNALTAAGQVVSEKIFTTLDPLARSVKLPSGLLVVFSDTVGFLRDLPHDLIEAFKATLEEVTYADLLIHVLDVSSPHLYTNNETVMDVLKELKADKKPMITALNKTDLLSDQGWLKTVSSDFPNCVGISAKSGSNLDLLIKEVESAIPDKTEELDIIIPHKRMDLVDLFYREGKVEEIRYQQKGISVRVRLPKALYNRIVSDKTINLNC